MILKITIITNQYSSFTLIMSNPSTEIRERTVKITIECTHITKIGYCHPLQDTLTITDWTTYDQLSEELSEYMLMNTLLYLSYKYNIQ